MRFLQQFLRAVSPTIIYGYDFLPKLPLSLWALSEFPPVKSLSLATHGPAISLKAKHFAHKYKNTRSEGLFSPRQQIDLSEKWKHYPIQGQTEKSHWLIILNSQTSTNPEENRALSLADCSWMENIFITAFPSCILTSMLLLHAQHWSLCPSHPSFQAFKSTFSS